jgi:cation:H+ antiporter
MIEKLLIFSASLFLIIKGATLATTYSAKIAESFRLSKYIVGFVIVAFISIIPETLISINSAIKGVPEFGLGTLFGGNIADLTLIFAILIIFAQRSIKVESKVLKNIRFYPLFLSLPILFGLNGYYSRIEGFLLLIAGMFFYYFIFKEGSHSEHPSHNPGSKIKNISLLLLSMIMLLVGSHFIVTSSTNIAHSLMISPVLIGMLVVSLGTTMPELFYSLKSVKKKEDSLAIGDILGTVLADATIVVGILAIINPFSFPIKIVYVTGIFMIVSSLILLRFMKTGRVISKKEGYFLLFFWTRYVVVEFIANT